MTTLVNRIIDSASEGDVQSLKEYLADYDRARKADILDFIENYKDRNFKNVEEAISTYNIIGRGQTPKLPIRELINAALDSKDPLILETILDGPETIVSQITALSRYNDFVPFYNILYDRISEGDIGTLKIYDYIFGINNHKYATTIIDQLLRRTYSNEIYNRLEGSEARDVLRELRSYFAFIKYIINESDYDVKYKIYGKNLIERYLDNLLPFNEDYLSDPVHLEYQRIIADFINFLKDKGLDINYKTEIRLYDAGYVRLADLIR